MKQILDEIQKTINSLSGYFLAFSIAVFTFLNSFVRIHNGDIWWALAEGRQIINTGQFPSLNTFSYTFPNHPWISTQWLFSVIAYLTHHQFGIHGLVILKVFIHLLILYFAYRIVTKKIDNPIIQSMLIILFILAINIRIMLRAHLFSILIFLIFVYLFNKHRNNPKKLFLPVSLLTIFWVNLHSGISFGLLFLFLAAFEDSVYFFFQNKLVLRKTFHSKIKKFALLGIIVFLATMINPMGYYYLIHSISHLGLNKLIIINEYQPAFALRWVPLFFYILSIVSILSIALKIYRKNWDMTFDFTAIIFLILAIKFNRIIPYFNCIALLQITLNLRQLPWSHSNNISKYYHYVMGLFLSVGMLFMIGKVKFLPTIEGFGFGVDRFRLPVYAVEFLKENPIPGNMYNKYFWGGYLSWELYPDAPIFVDGRIPAYPPEFIRTVTHLRNKPELFHQQYEKYDFQYIITANGYLQWDLKEEFGDSTWIEVYWDSDGKIIYAKNTDTHQRYIQEFGYQLYKYSFVQDDFDVLENDKNKLTLLIKEIERHIQWSPDKYVDRIRLQVANEKLAELEQQN